MGVDTVPSALLQAPIEASRTKPAETTPVRAQEQTKAADARAPVKRRTGSTRTQSAKRAAPGGHAIDPLEGR